MSDVSPSHHYLLGLGLLLLVLICGGGCTPEAPEHDSLATITEHRFKAEDNASFRETAFNDENWGTVPEGDPHRGGIALNSEGMGWHRLRFKVPSVRCEESLSIHLGLTGGADQAYLNGTLVGETGSIDLPRVSVMRQVRAYALPCQLLNSREDNILALRVLNNISPRTIEGPVFIAQSERVNDFARAIQARWTAIDTFTATIVFLSLLGWFGTYLAGFRGAESFWTGGTLLFLFLAFLMDHRSTEAHDLSPKLWATALIAYHLFVASLLLAVSSIVHTRPRLTALWVSTMCAAFGLGAALLPVEWRALAMKGSGGIGSLSVPLLAKWAFEVFRRPAEPIRRVAALAGSFFSLSVGWYGLCALTPLIKTTEAQQWVGQFFAAATCCGLLVAIFFQFLDGRNRVARAQLEAELARNAERRRVAQSLHDGVVQDLHAARLSLQSSEHLEPERRAQVVQNVSASLKQHAESLRVNSRSLFETSQHSWSEFFSVQKQQVTQAGLGWASSGTSFLSQFSGETRENIQLFLREAIGNSLQHSGAQQIRCEVQPQDSDLVVRVSDNGHWKEVTPRSGIGGSSMELRAHTLGGRLSIDSDAQGTRVHLYLPNSAD